MTLLRTEGFDWLPSGAFTDSYNAFSYVTRAASLGTFSGVPGRYAGSAISIAPTFDGIGENVTDQEGICFPLGSHNGTIIFGFAFKFSTLPTINWDYNPLTIASIRNAQVNTTAYNLTINLNTSYNLIVGHIDGNGAILGGDVLATGTKVFAADTWYYLECKYTPDAVTGSFIINIDGVEELNESSIDTINTSANMYTLTVAPNMPPGSAATSTLIVDDLYIADTSGSTNNDFLGPRAITTIVPAGNGTNSDFLGSDADSTDNFELVDELPPDDGVTYVESSTVTEKDTYDYGTTTAEGINGVSIKTFTSASSIGTPVLQNICLSGVTEDSSASIPVGTQYMAAWSLLEQDPDTSTDWTASSINAAEFGFKVV